jgi:hypothetical protein
MGVPCFSTEISVAWELLEKLQQDGMHFHVIGSVMEDRSESWFVVFRRSNCLMDAEEYARRFTGYAGTLPLAICRAALAAVNRCSDCWLVA